MRTLARRGARLRRLVYKAACGALLARGAGPHPEVARASAHAWAVALL